MGQRRHCQTRHRRKGRLRAVLFEILHYTACLYRDAATNSAINLQPQALQQHNLSLSSSCQTDCGRRAVY